MIPKGKQRVCKRWQIGKEKLNSRLNMLFITTLAFLSFQRQG